MKNQILKLLAIGLFAYVCSCSPKKDDPIPTIIKTPEPAPSQRFYENTVSDDFDITPKDSSVKTGSYSLFVTGTPLEMGCNANIKNTIIPTSKKSDSVFVWIKLPSLPSSWSPSAVCDPFACSFPLIDSASFVLKPGKSGLMNVYFYPNENEGEGNVKLYVCREGRREKGIFINYKAIAKK